MRDRRSYPTDLTDREWAILEPLVPASKPGGRPCRWSRREIVDAIFYLVRSGEAWRLLPHDLPPWQTVYHYFRLWRKDGTWERIHSRLREETRRRMGREPTPSGAIIARPVGQDHGKGGPPHSDGYDAGKKLTGRKRHLLVDTQGLVLKALVHPADLHDRDGGRLVLEAIPDLPQRFPRLRHLWVDAAYRGRFVEWVQATFGWSVKVVKHWWTGASAVWVMPGQEPPEIPAGFQLLPWRWIVERTFAWLGRSRRLSKDYEFLPATGEAMIYLAMSRLMLRRLAQSP